VPVNLADIRKSNNRSHDKKSKAEALPKGLLNVKKAIIEM